MLALTNPHHHPMAKKLMVDADHIDIKVVEGKVTLREFLANMFSYMPLWLRGLYTIRKGFVRLLGMRQEGMPQGMRIEPSKISFEKGGKAGFFEIIEAKEDEYYFSGARESHLTAVLGVVPEPLENKTRFHVYTIVHYHRFTGPIYFNVIRPFHHFVVGAMIRNGVKNEVRP